MVAQPQRNYIPPEEYLLRERDAETKSEYADGQIVAMAGASPEHDRIAGDIFGELRSQLKGASCEPFTSDVRLWAPECNRYFYPDTTVACGAQFQVLEGMESLLNASVVIEVLSPTTENFDRGRKRECYQTLESLSAYVLVAQDRPYIEVFTRLEDGDWRLHSVAGLHATLKLTTIQCEVKLSDIYARAGFNRAEPEMR